MESIISTIPIHSAERQPCRTQHRHAGALATLTVLSISLAALAAPAAAQEKKPNILFIMGDDIGWMQVGLYHQGVGLGETPNIDRIGKEGGKFTTYYAMQSCTSGRNVFFTGMYPLLPA
jgi:hypothetical protein